ncbi:DUF4158 domain-containing protein [Streptomyces lydicus]|uniref:DUF4158 domain-containing protein n=1 Tax=Streptomyces lydicus TaxID=47763 RepID=UPI0013E97A15|nr:DUF4158 domain-containing protein [Streptomyces lydicus]
MRQEWSPEELLASWTLVDGDWDLVANKSGSTRLGFSLMLKFFESEGRFPDLLEEVPQAAVEYVAGLVEVPAADFTKYDLTSRSAKNHRKQIREALKFRPATRADEEELIAWLADEVCPVELVEDRLREALLVECRERTIEPPGRIDRIVTAAQTRAGRRSAHGPSSALAAGGGGPASGAGDRGQRGRRRSAGRAQARPGRGRSGLPADGDHQAERRAETRPV